MRSTTVFLALAISAIVIAGCAEKQADADHGYSDALAASIVASAEPGAVPGDASPELVIDPRTWAAAEKLFFSDPATAQILKDERTYDAWRSLANSKKKSQKHVFEQSKAITLMREAHREMVEQGLLPNTFHASQQQGSVTLERVNYNPFETIRCDEGFYAVGEVCRKRCPEGRTSAGDWVDACVDDPHYASRNLFGNCPGGYVDHPTKSDLCVVPALAEQWRRARR